MALQWSALFLTASVRNCHEGVHPIELIVGDHHKEGEHGLLYRKQVVLSRLPFKKGGGITGLLEELRDRGRRHFG